MAEHIPKEFLELVLQRTDLVALVDARVPLRKKTGSNYFACCPFHQEKTASFSVSQAKQFYYCFGCGAHGNAIDFLIQYDRLSFPEAVEALAKQLGMNMPHLKTQDKTFSLQHYYSLLEKVVTIYQAELHKNSQALAYFKQRGISEEIIQQFSLGFSPREEVLIQALGKNADDRKALQETGMISNKDGRFYERFRERIMFPIHDRRGRVIGFGGRIIHQGEPKYLNSPETPLFQKGHELYGLYQVLKANRQLSRLLIVEGYMDMIALFQQGITYAVATLGTATTSYHIQSLFRYTPEIVFCFDGDNAGRRAAERALQVVLPIVPDNIQFRFMFLPEGDDPDSLIRRESKTRFEERIFEAQTLSQYFFHLLAANLDLSTADGKACYIKSGLDQIKNIPEGIFKETLLSELSQKTRTEVKTLLKEKASPATFTPPQGTKRASILRHLLALIIQYPQLAQYVDEPLTPAEIPGTSLFNQIVTLATAQPQLSTGILLEYWRNQPEEKWLAALAQQTVNTPLAGLKAEFLGALQQARRQAKEHTIQKLLEKGSLGLLTPEEKSNLMLLINNKNLKATTEPC